MRNCSLGLAIVLLGCALSCGDNSRACGPGTVNEFGSCVPAATCGFGTKPDEETGECVPDGSIVCTDGTIFNPLTGTCEIDPEACQNGTVLINNMCVDPTLGLTVDVQEGPEPNGLGFIEASLAQAGNAAIKPQGGPAFVIHGTIDPHRDADGDGALDPDVDTYVLSVAAPTLVRITADGLNGITAGFVALAAVDSSDPFVAWRRLGMNLTGDTSKRQVYLPKAGTYHLAIADTRTLFEATVIGNAPTAAPGGDDGEYYVSIDQLAPPTVTPLAVGGVVANVNGTVDNESIRFFSVPMGSGFNLATLTMPSTFATASLVITNNGVLRAFSNEPPASVVFGGIEGGDQTVFVVDYTYNLSPSPVDFNLRVRVSTATPLSGTGGTVMVPATTNQGNDFLALNQFSLDVAAETIGLTLGVSSPIVGQLYDSNGQRAATFTSPPSTSTWTSYRGLVRLPKAGRYYFAVYAPSATSATVLSVTSTIAPLIPEIVLQGTPFTQPLGALRIEPFSYDASADGWHSFNVTGTNTGGQLVSWFDPALTFGRLDSLVTNTGTLPGEVVPIFSRSFAATGGAFGRVVLDDPRTTYYVKVNAVNPTTSPQVSLNFQRRPAMVDFGALMPATTTVRTGDTIDSTTPSRFYLFRAAAGKTVTITVTPTSAVNTQFRRLRADETALGPLVNNPNGPDVETLVQGGTWTAFVVSAAGGLSAARTFDVSVQIQ